MSRRRCTTAKMFSDRPGGGKRPSQSRPSTVDSVAQDNGVEPLTAEALARHLAAEAMLRDASEQRTTWAITRYFKLTLALAGINILLAGTTVFALWSRPDRSTTAVSANAVQPKPELKPVVSILPPAPAPVASPTSPATALSAGQPAPVPPKTAPVAPSPSTKHEASGTPTRIRRPAAKAQVAHQEVDQEQTVALDSVVERW